MSRWTASETLVKSISPRVRRNAAHRRATRTVRKKRPRYGVLSGVYQEYLAIALNDEELLIKIEEQIRATGGTSIRGPRA